MGATDSEDADGRTRPSAADPTGIRDGAVGAEPEKGSGRGGALRLLVAVVVSGVLVAVLLGRASPERIVTSLTEADRGGLAAFVGAALVLLALRVARYWLLLDRRVRVWPLTLVTQVRGMLVDLVPARLGSWSWVWLLRTRLGTPLGLTLSAFFQAFLFDSLAIAPLLIVALVVVGAGGSASLALLIGVSTALLIVAAVLMRFFEPLLRAVARRAERLATGSGRLGHAAERVAAAATATADATEEARGRGLLVPLLLLSLAIRLVKYFAYWQLLGAVLAPHGESAPGFFVTLLGAAAAELSGVVPIPALAGLGTFEAAWALGFTTLGIDAELAIISGFATHLLSQVYDYSLGIVALLLLSLPGRWRPTSPSGS